jgi:hypothetical protein
MAGLSVAEAVPAPKLARSGSGEPLGSSLNIQKAIGVTSRHSTIALQQKGCEKTNAQHSTSNVQLPEKSKAESIFNRKERKELKENADNSKAES